MLQGKFDCNTWRLLLVPVAVWSKAYADLPSSAEIVGSNPSEGIRGHGCLSVRVLGRGLCDELITRPEESYRLWCVVVCVCVYVYVCVCVCGLETS